MVKKLASILTFPYICEPTPPRVKEHKPLIQIHPALSLPGFPSLLVNLVLPTKIENNQNIKPRTNFIFPITKYKIACH